MKGLTNHDALRKAMQSVMEQLNRDIDDWMFGVVECERCGKTKDKLNNGSPCWDCLSAEEKSERYQRNLDAYLGPPLKKCGSCGKYS